MRAAVSATRTNPHHTQKKRTLLGDELRDVEQVAEQRLVLLGRLAEARQAVARLRDDQKVDGRLRADVAEGERLVVLVQHRRRDLLGDDLVKDGRALAVGKAFGLFLFWC